MDRQRLLDFADMSDRTPPTGGMLLVTVDRLPAWIMPAYGCTWVATPTLTALAARGLVCDRLIAGGDDPLETLAALAGRSSEASADWPLVTAAGRGDWAPTIVTDDDAFATSLPPGLPVHRISPPAATRIARTAAETTFGRLFTRAAELVAGNGHRFVWCHAASLATAWDAPDEFRTAYLDPEDPPPPAGAGVPDVALDERTDPDFVAAVRHVFAGQLTLLDACLAMLLDAVADRQADHPWTVLVAGVRGLGLGLHGRIGCGPLPPFGELLHLPAILVDPGGRMAAQRYGELLLPADIAATLLQQTGAATPAGDDPWQGRSLEGLFQSWRIPQRDRVLSSGAGGLAIATPAWHLVLPAADDGAAAPLLYAKPDDYFEVCDVADRCSDVATELAELARLAASDPAAAWTKRLSDAASGGVG